MVQLPAISTRVAEDNLGKHNVSGHVDRKLRQSAWLVWLGFMDVCGALVAIHLGLIEVCPNLMILVTVVNLFE